MQKSVEIFSRRAFLLALLLLVLVLAIPLATSIGLYNVSFLDIYKLILSGGIADERSIVLWIRLRRVLVGVFVGALLGGAGTVCQAVFRNPLASPFTLGISQASALGVAIALLTGYGGSTTQWFLSFARPYLLPLAAFVFALIQVSVILLLASRAGLSPYALVLSSIAMSFIYQSILALIQYLFLNELQIATIVFWMFGDLAKPGNMELTVLALGSIPLLAAYLAIHLDLDLLSLGDEVASSSGVNPGRLRLVAVLIAAAGTALATCFVGVLAFLGLVAPHITREIVGSTHRYLMPASMLVGAIMLVLADAVGRTMLNPMTLPVGIVLSFIGAPLLLILLLRGASQWRS